MQDRIAGLHRNPQAEKAIFDNRQPRRRRTLWLAAVCAVAFAVLAFFVQAGITTPFDNLAVTRATTLSSTRGLVPAANLASSLASLPSLAAVLLVSSYLLGRSRSDRHRLFMLQCASLVGAGILNLGLKVAFGRLRPEVALVAETGLSFPSGHSMLSMAAFGLVALLVMKRVRNPRAKTALVAAMGVTIALVGASRVLLGVHYPTDVLGGFLASLAWILLVSRFIPEGRPTEARTARVPAAAPIVRRHASAQIP